MENSYFICSPKDEEIRILRFHNCTWEFGNNKSLVEFGFEISNNSLAEKKQLEISLYIPWFTERCEITDLYQRLKDTANSRFIFNDSVSNSISLDGGNNTLGVIHEFTDRNKLCLLPIIVKKEQNKIIIQINLDHYNRYQAEEKPNIYIRLSIKPSFPYISTRKKGIAKSTVIYDIKINERRNIPNNLVNEISGKEICKIENCFSFTILPNRYDILFHDNKSLKNIRNLEHTLFHNYIGSIIKIPKDELIVIFCKKGNTEESYSFFSIYSTERIGIAQFSFAILLNIFCSLLFYIASLKYTPKESFGYDVFIFELPIEVYSATALFLLTLVYFLWPFVRNFFSTIKRRK